MSDKYSSQNQTCSSYFIPGPSPVDFPKMPEQHSLQEQLAENSLAEQSYNDFLIVLIENLEKKPSVPKPFSHDLRYHTIESLTAETSEYTKRISCLISYVNLPNFLLNFNFQQLGSLTMMNATITQDFIKLCEQLPLICLKFENCILEGKQIDCSCLAHLKELELVDSTCKYCSFKFIPPSQLKKISWIATERKFSGNFVDISAESCTQLEHIELKFLNTYHCYFWHPPHSRVHTLKCDDNVRLKPERDWEWFSNVQELSFSESFIHFNIYDDLCRKFEHSKEYDSVTINADLFGFLSLQKLEITDISPCISRLKVVMKGEQTIQLSLLSESKEFKFNLNLKSKEHHVVTVHPSEGKYKSVTLDPSERNYKRILRLSDFGNGFFQYKKDS